MINDSLIFDLGAAKGGDTEYYLSLGYNVVAVDAVKANCEYLIKQFE